MFIDEAAQSDRVQLPFRVSSPEVSVGPIAHGHYSTMVMVITLQLINWAHHRYIYFAHATALSV